MAAHNNQNHEKQCSVSLSVLNAKVAPQASSELIRHLAPGPGATALAVLARCSFLFVPKHRVFTVVFTGIFTQDSPTKDGTKTRQFSTSFCPLKCLSPRASRGRRPLHLAAEDGRVEVLERLLAAKATVDAEDEDGWGAPELGTRTEGCGDCVHRIQRDSLRVTRVG